MFRSCQWMDLIVTGAEATAQSIIKRKNTSSSTSWGTGKICWIYKRKKFVIDGVFSVDKVPPNPIIHKTQYVFFVFFLSEAGV